jgi:type IV pilus assembly protein PilN
MIRINLLPVREARRRADIQQQLMLLGLVMGVSIVVCVLVQVAMMASVSRAQSRVAQLDSQIAEFKTQLAQVEEFKRKAAEIESKLDVIRQLDLSRTGPVRLLDELASRTPEKLWVTKLETDGSRIQLKGLSIDTELIADFLNRLNDSPYIKDVELQGTELSEVDGLKLNSFQLTAVLTNPEAEAAPKPVAAPAAAPAAAAKRG